VQLLVLRSFLHCGEALFLPGIALAQRTSAAAFKLRV
jgi:hypothetical protein